MIRRILIIVIVLLGLVFVAAWLLGGGIASIKAAVSHYSLPSGNLIEFIAGTGPDSLGEQFTLPGTPSSFPTVPFPEQNASSSPQTNGPTIVPAQSQQNVDQQQQLQELEQQYQETEQQIQQINQQQNQSASNGSGS